MVYQPKERKKKKKKQALIVNCIANCKVLWILLPICSAFVSGTCKEDCDVLDE
jgi:hypothetical protein